MDSLLMRSIFEVLVGEICPDCAYFNSTRFSSASNCHLAQYKPLITAISNSTPELGDIGLRSLWRTSLLRSYDLPMFEYPSNTTATDYADSRSLRILPDPESRSELLSEVQRHFMTTAVARVGSAPRS